MGTKRQFLKIIERQLYSLVVDTIYDEEKKRYINIVNDEKDLQQASRLQKISASFRLPSKNPNRKKYRRKKWKKK